MTYVYRDELEIPYTSRNFPRGTVPHGGCLRTNWSELLWAAITVGRPNTAYVFRHREASYHEALFRLSLVRMALTQQPSSRSLHRTKAFRTLDPTEKGAVSYFIGMTVSKLFASQLLNTPWLLHLDIFRDSLDPVVLGGRSRPDLVGQDHQGAWHAFESKGRSSVPNTEDKRKAKVQARRLVTVNNINCTLHIGAISYLRRDRLEFYWCDPDPEEPETLEPIKLRLPEDAWRIYYELAFHLASERMSEGGSGNRAPIDVDIEIHPRIRGLLFDGEWTAGRSLANEIEDQLREEGFHADGLKVVAGESWRQPF